MIGHSVQAIIFPYIVHCPVSSSFDLTTTPVANDETSTDVVISLDASSLPAMQCLPTATVSNPSNSETNTINRTSDEPSIAISPSVVYTAASSNEQTNVHGTCNQAKNKLAIFKLVQPYAKEFIPKLCLDVFPHPISELYNSDALIMGYADLIKECKAVFETIQV